MAPVFLSAFIQKNRTGVDLPVEHGDNSVGGAEVPDAAGIDEPGVAPAIDQRAMGMTEEEKIQLLFLGGISGREQRLLHTVGMAMAEEDTLVLHEDQLFSGEVGAEVAVARHLFQRDVGEVFVECFRVTPAISQMNDHAGRGLLHRPDHIFNVAVRVGENQHLHGNSPFPEIDPV